MSRFQIIRTKLRKKNKFSYLTEINHYLDQTELKNKFNRDLKQILKHVNDIKPNNNSVW